MEPVILAVDAKEKQLLGCMGQKPFVHEPAPEKESRAEHNTRWRESLIWEQSIERIGLVPSGTQWIYVGDRGSDLFRFWQQLGYDSVTRAAQNRNVLVEEEQEQANPTAEHLKSLARRLPAQDVVVMTVVAERGRLEQEALANISWSQVSIQPPTNGTALSMTPLSASLVHVYQPPEGVEALEWILVTFHHGQHHKRCVATRQVVPMKMAH